MEGLIRKMLTTPVDRQDILEYLSLFTDPSKMNADAGATVHPLDVVMNAFQDTCAGNTCQKIHTFLEDAFEIHGKTFQQATWPTAPQQ